MTREEAIEWLNTDDYHSAGYNEALDMAIQALLRNDIPDTNVGDTISRQAAIDAIIKADYEFTGILSEPRARKFEQTINALPPAQPEIIRCKDCKHRDDDDFCTGRGYPNALVPDDGFCDKGERRE